MEATAAPGRRHDLRTLLRERDFRLLLSSQFMAQCADGLAQAAFADVIVLEPGPQDAPERILALFALTLLPYSFIAPFLGVFVDRWDRRALLLWTNVIRAGLLVTLPFWGGAIPGDGELYAGVLVLLGLGRLFLVTKGAALPVVVHEHHLLQSNSVSGGGGMISALVGGALGAGAVGIGGARWSFVVAGVIYAGAGLTARRISHSMAHPEPPEESLAGAVRRMAGELVDGIRQVWRRPYARLPLQGIFVLRTAGMVTAIAAILVIQKEFPDAGDRFGRLSTAALALGAAGIGAFVGAVTAPALGRRLSNAGLIMLGFAVSGLGIVALGGIQRLEAVLALTFIGGLGAFLAKIPTDAQVQEAMPDEYRGRAFALYDILYNVASVAAALVMFGFAATDSRLLLMSAGAVTLGLALLLGRAMRGAGMSLRAGV